MNAEGSRGPEHYEASTRIAVDLEPSPDAAAEARAAISQLRSQVAEQVFTDLCQVISELVSNSVSYGPAESITVRVRLDGDEILGEVEDRGRGRIAIREDSAGASGGFGLRIVDAMSTEWGVHDGSTHVWFRIST